MPGDAVSDGVDAIRARLHRYARDDHEAVLDIGALKEVAALLDTDQIGLDVARTCGLLLWCRSLHGPDDADDLISALALLEPVWRADATQVPEGIAEYFEEFGPGPVKLTDRWQGPAHALAQHARESGDAQAGALAVALMRRIVAATEPTDSERGEYLANLAMAGQELAEMTGSGAELDEAVAAGRLAIAAFDLADPRRTVAVAATAVALRRRSGRTGNAAELDEAITLGRAAVRATASGDPARAGRLSNLGVALTYRYEWSGRRADFDAAIAAHREAVTTTDAMDRQRAARLTNLVTTLLASFEDTGRLDELAAALTAIDEAATIPTPVDGVRAAVRSSLCTTLRARFRYTGNSADLDRAVRAGASAVALLPPGHPDLPLALTNVGLARHVRARRRESADELDRAIDDLRAAADATPAGHPDRAGRLSNLCDALLSRADLGGAAARVDLDEAVACGQSAVTAGAAHRRGAYYLSNLGNALLARHTATSGRHDLDEAITVQERAVATCAPDASHLAACLANLAVARYTRYQLAPRATEDLDRAIVYARRAAAAVAGPVEVRIRAAVRWGHWAATAGRWAQALAGYTAAVDLLADVSPGDLPRDDQEFELARLGGVVTDAAACALHAEDPHAAVRLLEQGRGIVLAHALPDVAPEAIAGVGQVSGPIVMVNVSRFRSDALLLTDNGVTVKPLPSVDPDTVRAKAEQFLLALSHRNQRQAGAMDAARAEAAVSDILVWLWDAIAGPVLDRLEFTGTGAPPRLWWCPAGLLSILPLHAAGRHDTATDTVMDRVISSTTPNLRALVNSRRDTGRRSPDGARLLLVADPALPAAREEGRLLRELFPDETVTFLGSTGKELAEFRRVHVAGHAVADLTSPSRSRIVLDGGRPPLTADALSRLRDVDGELAFLSACETARTSPALADETVHLASVLHVAGYRHVIATLWTIADRPALRTARAVYTDLAGHDDITRVPAALHNAVLQLRERYPDHPLTWATYVHLGP